jgi:heptaprenylglyceryl phosphate synthase
VASPLDSPFSTNIEGDTLARARATVAALRGTDRAIVGGMSGLVNDALRAEIERLEAEHNAGIPFPDVARLKRGKAI